MTEQARVRQPATRPGGMMNPRNPFVRDARLQGQREPLAGLVTGFVVAVATLVLFGVLAEDVATHEAIVFDGQANTALHRFATPILDVVMNTATLLGSAYVLGPLVLLVLIALLVTRRKRTAAFLAVAAVGGALLDEVLKLTFQRARPGLPWAAPLHTYSFPSGHSMSSLVCYLALALVVWRVFGRQWGVLAVVFAALLVLTIGISRMYLGVHYFSDVLGEFAAGTCWVSGVATAIGGWQRHFTQQQGT